MKPKIIAVIVIAVFVIGGGVYIFKQLFASSVDTDGGPVYAYKEVVHGDISVGIEAVGTLQPSSGGGIQIPGTPSYGASPAVNYVIDEILVKEGDVVKRGDLLVRLIAPDLESQIESREKQLIAEKESLADLLNTSVDRLDRIDSSRGIILHAPIDGRVIGLNVTEGKKLNEGEIVARVVDDSKFKLVAKLTLNEFFGIEVGQKVALGFSQFDSFIEGYITDVNPYPVPEKLAEVDLAANNNISTDDYLFVHWVSIEAENPGLIHPGMRVKVGISKNPKADQLDMFNMRWLRFEAPVDSYVDEERVLSRAEAIATRVFVRNMEVVKKGDPLVSLAGEDAQKTIQERVASIREKEEELRQLVNRYNQLEILSPMDGIVAYIEDNPGKTVQAGDWIGSIYNTSNMRMNISVDDIDVVMVSQGAPVQIRLDAAPGEIFKGEVLFVSSMGRGDGITRFNVDIKVEGSPVMRPGMQARAYIDAGRAEDVLIIPIEAVFEENGQSKVEVLDADGIVRLVPIKTGLMNNREAEVLEGLEEGQLVIVGSTADLLPSQRIGTQDSILPERSDEGNAVDR